MTNQITDFTPEGWDAMEQKTSSKYWNASEFPIGETLLRVLSKPITGWLEWFEKKPYRYKALEKPENTKEYPRIRRTAIDSLKTALKREPTENEIRDEVKKDPKSRFKKFWAFVAWDYERADWYILEISQSSIITEMAKLLPNLGAQDFKIMKGGEKELTRYMVFPCKPTMASGSVLDAQKSINVNLEALYSGDDPFSKITNLKP